MTLLFPQLFFSVLHSCTCCFFVNKVHLHWVIGARTSSGENQFNIPSSNSASYFVVSLCVKELLLVVSFFRHSFELLSVF